MITTAWVTSCGIYFYNNPFFDTDREINTPDNSILTPAELLPPLLRSTLGGTERGALWEMRLDYTRGPLMSFEDAMHRWGTHAHETLPQGAMTGFLVTPCREEARVYYRLFLSAPTATILQNLMSFKSTFIGITCTRKYTDGNSVPINKERIMIHKMWRI